MTVRWSVEPTLRRPGDDRRVLGLERRGRRRDPTRCAGSRASRTRARSPHSTSRSTSTSKPRGRPSSSSTASCARSTGRRSRSRPARCRRAARDLVLLLGVEPNLRWRSFCDDVISVARTTGLRDDRDRRRAARRHAAHAPDPMHGLGHRRSARGAARHATVALRRTDRASSACCTTRCAASDSRRRRSGRRCRTTSRPPPNPKATRAIARPAERAARPRARSHRPRHRVERVGTIGLRSRRRRRRRQLVRRTAREPLTTRRTANRAGSKTDDEIADDDDEDDDDWFDEDDLPSGESLAEDFERYLRDQPED